MKLNMKTGTHTNKQNRPKTILLCEDDHFSRRQMTEVLRDHGYRVFVASTESQSYKQIREHGQEADVAIVDVRLPKNSHVGNPESESGKTAGIRIARFIRDRFPQIRVIGVSFFSDADTRVWFSEHCFAYMHKTWLMDPVDARAYGLRIVDQAAHTAYRQRKPSSFIVHGHDTKSLDELKHLIRHRLGWERPKVLREMLSGGRTLIEKFEDAAKTVDAVFVLLTPDDKAAPAKAPDEIKRRARQNVIFEMGYFFGKMQRAGGRVILLHHGKVELPSDIHGIVYIDISDGVTAAIDDIRREVANIRPCSASTKRPF
jgi:predicted nucleotide-binding protein/ActR/RegA family two-component response regulator